MEEDIIQQPIIINPHHPNKNGSYCIKCKCLQRSVLGRGGSHQQSTHHGRHCISSSSTVDVECWSGELSRAKARQ